VNDSIKADLSDLNKAAQEMKTAEAIDQEKPTSVVHSIVLPAFEERRQRRMGQLTRQRYTYGMDETRFIVRALQCNRRK
jgi:hypothetical protein